MEIKLDSIQLIANQILEQFRGVLESEGINNTSTLSKTADITVDLNDDKLVISLMLEPYWKWVEYGRKAGGFPPPDTIKDWIRVKPIVPNVRNGKVPTTDQLAFIIGRKIAMHGTPARHPIQKTVWSKETDSIIQLIKSEIVRQLSNYYLG